MTYKETIIEALKNLGGHAYYQDIYEMFEKIYTEELPHSWHAIIRATIEANSKDSSVFKGEDIFYTVEGLGKGHWGLKGFEAESNAELTQEDDEFSEGKIKLRLHLSRERNPSLIAKAKKIFKEKNGSLFCEICGFSFVDTYGELGENFIEAHHTKAISKMCDGEKTKIEDVAMVCSNCHSMLHRKKSWLNKNQLKILIDNNKNNSI